MAESSSLTVTPRTHEKRSERVERYARPIVAGLFVLLALIGLIGSAIRDPRPHDIPVGIVGPAPATQQLATAFGANAPGTFGFTTFVSEDAARAALDARSVDGVLVLGGAPRLIVAGAAGDTVTTVMTAAFSSVFRAQGATLAVETVHRFAAGDAHGLILFFVIVAVLIATLISQALLGTSRQAAGLAERLMVAVVFALLAAPAAMGAAAWLAGDYGPGFWAAMGLVALASAAVGAVTAGSIRLLGAAGLGLAALIVILLDLVSSGGPVGSQMLPDFYRWLAPAMPAGQLYESLRDALYFDGNGLGQPVLGLSAWLLGGLLLMLLAELVIRRTPAAATATATATSG
jgi:hypothetical protein